MTQNKIMQEIAKALAESKDDTMQIVGGGALTRSAEGVKNSEEFKKVFVFKEDKDDTE